MNQQFDNMSKEFLSFLQTLDAQLLVTDLETNEVLFANDKMREHHCVRQKPPGHKCWDNANAKCKRCQYCPMEQLIRDPTSTVVWEEMHTPTGRWYKESHRIVKWIDGRLVHLQQCTDITTIKQQAETLSQRLKQQQLMSDIAHNFLSGNSLPVLLQNALKMSGQFIGADRILIYQIDADQRCLTLKYQWSKDVHTAGIASRSISFQEDTRFYNALYDKLSAPVAVDDTLTRENLSFLASLSIRSFSSIPIFVEGRHWGTICSVSCTEPRVWDDSDIHLGKMLSGVIGEVLGRTKIEEDLFMMSSIADSSPYFIGHMDKQGGFQYVNQGAVDTTGYSREQILRQGVRLLLNEEDYNRMCNELIPLVYRNSQWSGTLNFHLACGDIHPFACSSFPVPQGGMATIAYDIHDKLLLEKELLTAKEQAERSNRAKSEFLSRMSHEMRTPLNAIIGMTTIAQGGDLDRVQYCINKISDASTHLLGVINDILDMSKIEAGKFELSETDFLLDKMLLQITTMVNFRVEEKRQNFVIKVDKDVPQAIVADQQRLSQVITNLLSNAVKFTPEEGDIRLLIRVEQTQGDTITLGFQVVDTGIGIEAGKQAKLFQSFEQADGSITRRFGGTGLGLSISKSIVEQMGGSIQVESQPGRGSCFSFTIRTQKGTSTHIQGLCAKPETMKVLFVDNCRETRDFFMDVSESLGIACRCASTDHEALQAIERDHSYDIIFVDYLMPGIDRLQLIRKIKELCSSNIIIMISVSDWATIEKEAKKAGASHFISKPLLPSTIIDIINECLGPANLQGRQAYPERNKIQLFNNKKLLLAEDVAINREILISFLENTGIEVVCAENGLAACELFSAAPEKYDMILMDIHMPVMDGYQATRRIRALDNPWAQQVPIVAMTANVFREDVDKCLECGMNDHIGKPVEMESVIAKLKSYLCAAPD